MVLKARLDKRAVAVAGPSSASQLSELRWRALMAIGCKYEGTLGKRCSSSFCIPQFLF